MQSERLKLLSVAVYTGYAWCCIATVTTTFTLSGVKTACAITALNYNTVLMPLLLLLPLL
jgi:hypothetical protein